MKASLGRKTHREASPGWRAVRVLLAIVFSFAIAFSVVGQEPSRPQKRKPINPASKAAVPQTRVPAPAAPESLIPVPDRRPGGTEWVPGGNQAVGPTGPHTKHPTPVLVTPTPLPPVRVPDIVGLGLKRGFSDLSEAGLVGQFVGKEKSSRRSGEIARQKPPAGTIVKPGTKVDVWVSASRTFPSHWVAIIVGALAVIGVVWMCIPRNGNSSHTHRVEFVPFKDNGEQQIISTDPLAFALELSPILDPGDQNLEKVGALVAAGRSSWTSEV